MIASPSIFVSPRAYNVYTERLWRSKRLPNSAIDSAIISIAVAGSLQLPCCHWISWLLGRPQPSSALHPPPIVFVFGWLLNSKQLSPRWAPTSAVQFIEQPDVRAPRITKPSRRRRYCPRRKPSRPKNITRTRHVFYFKHESPRRTPSTSSPSPSRSWRTLGIAPPHLIPCARPSSPPQGRGYIENAAPVVVCARDDEQSERQANRHLWPANFHIIRYLVLRSIFENLSGYQFLCGIIKGGLRAFRVDRSHPKGFRSHSNLRGSS